MNLREFFSVDCSVAGMLAKYRRSVNPSVFVHSVNLAGYAQAQVDPKGVRTQLKYAFDRSASQPGRRDPST